MVLFNSSNNKMETGDHFKNGVSMKSLKSRGNRICRIIIYCVLFFLCFLNIFSQDVITLKNGDDIQALVQEVGDVDIRYKKFENPDGPVYTMKKSEIFMIKYINGSKDVFIENLELVSNPTPVTLSEQTSVQTSNTNFKINKKTEIVIYKYDFRIGSNRPIKLLVQKMKALGFCCVYQRGVMNESNAKLKIVFHPNGFSTFKFRIYNLTNDEQVFENNYTKTITINRVVENFIKDITPFIED